MPVVRFHRSHGENIRLLDHRMVSYRKHSFAHAISFSEKPLRPMELFLIEIEQNERGWSGHLRIGLTQLAPSKGHHLPQYALPDLANIGKSWIFAVTKSHNKVMAMNHRTGLSSILGDKGEYVQTFNGSLHKSVLKPSVMPQVTTKDDIDRNDVSSDSDPDILPTDVGSRIGIVYMVKDNMAEMHFIINGEDQGPCVKDIPYGEGPLHAVIDVYGTTKQVRIVQLYGAGTLQNACREVILKSVKKDGVSELPIPTKLKEYLNYETT